MLSPSKNIVKKFLEGATFFDSHCSVVRHLIHLAVSDSQSTQCIVE